MNSKQKKQLKIIKQRYDARHLDYGVKGSKWGYNKGKANGKRKANGKEEVKGVKKSRSVTTPKYAIKKLSSNPAWASGYKKAVEAFGDVLPKDEKHSVGINFKGEKKKLAIQGEGFVDLFNRTAKKNQYLSVDEIKQHPLIKAMDEMSDRCIEALGGQTKFDNSPERQALREEMLSSFMSIGAARKTESGKYEYDGEIKKEFKACIVIGLPACGKSTTKVDPWSEENGAFVMDNDVIKSLTPEFQATGGCAAGAVHEECSDLNKRALESFISGDRKGDNIALPIIGDNYDKVMEKYVSKLEEAGYDVEVKFAEGDAKTSANRVVNRAIGSGRIIASDIVFGYGNRPVETRDAFKGKVNAKGKPYLRD